tara:strand:+ start:5818 stop:6441 length:624 start_codon:yes stop_codon:yes gene_type:complete
MALVKLDWNRKSVPEKLIKGGYILQQMTLNATAFLTPNPALPDVQLAFEDLVQKTTAAQAGGYALTFAKNEAELAFDELITQLASYVQNISGGKESIIIQSGMDVRKTPSPIPPPPQVENLDALPTRTTGEVQLTWDTLGRNYDYQVEQWVENEKGDGFWDRIGLPSKSKFTVTGLTTGTVYRFRVAGIGKDDEIGPYSQDAVSVAP